MVSMPQAEDLDDHMDDVGIAHTARGASDQVGNIIPDLNVSFVDQGSGDVGPLLSSLLREAIGFQS